MTWLYVPSVSAQASEVSTSASASLDPTRAASLSWRGKHQQPQAWSRAWKRGGFIRLLSGLTCELSTLERGVVQWIASCRAIPAKETASPESGSVKPMTAGCSTELSRSSIKAGLRPSSARTFLGTSSDSSRLPSQHWSDWAAGLRQEYSARSRPEPTTGESASSFWPTAVVKDDGKTPEGHLAMKKRMGERDGTFANRTAITSLSVIVQQWSTPKASDGEKGGPNMRGSKGDQPLPSQAAHWASPRLRDYRGSGPATTRSDGKSRMDMLDYQAEQGFHSLHLGQPIPDGQTSLPQRRRLNPLFVEWLMGWPEGLSGFDTAGTASCHSPQPSHGCGCMACWLTTQREHLSRLLTIAPPAQASLF